MSLGCRTVTSGGAVGRPIIRPAGLVEQGVHLVGRRRRGTAPRLRDARRAKSAEGRHAVGQYRYGYTGAGKGRDRNAALRADEQAAVARIVELRRAGESYRAIAASLDTEGHRPRRAATWSAMAVAGGGAAGDG